MIGDREWNNGKNWFRRIRPEDDVYGEITLRDGYVQRLIHNKGEHLAVQLTTCRLSSPRLQIFPFSRLQSALLVLYTNDR